MSAGYAVHRSAGVAGAQVAAAIASLVESASTTRSHVVLGCPAGRTPAAVYAALGREAALRQLDLARLQIVMMDEYAEPVGDGFRAIDPEAPHSCRRFAQELRRTLNHGLRRPRHLPVANLHLPDPQAPERHDDLIRALGGVDVFLLAAGSSDGHVGFNPPGSPADSRTRVVELAASTRRDNLRTSPSFRTIDAVPRFGVTVGLGTVAQASRRVVLLMFGGEKRPAFERTVATAGFDPAWPASIIRLCRWVEIVVDEAAAGLPVPDVGAGG